MAIGFGYMSSATPGTGELSWTHPGSGTAQGVVVYVLQYGNGTDQVTGVTYGGQAMTEVTGSPLLKTSGEAMTVYCYTLLSNIGTGNQPVCKRQCHRHREGSSLLYHHIRCYSCYQRRRCHNKF